MQKKAIAWATACTLAGIGMPAASPSASAQQPDATEERIRKLEEQLQSVTEELSRLKEEAAARRAQAAQPAAPTPAAAETQALKKEVEELKGRVAEVQDQATSTEAKLDQNGVRAYLGPGLIFEDPRGRWRMQVSGRAQLDYRAFSPEFSSADTFSIRRARIGVSATILDDYGVFVEEEFANQSTNPAPNNAPILTFAYVDLNWFRPGLRFRLGQFKPSISLDNMMLDLQTDFLERSFTQSLLGSVYDAGIQVFGEPVPGLFWAGSITNGAGQGNSEPQSNLQQATQDGKMWTVRLVNDFAQTFKIPDTVIHLGGAYQQTGFANTNTNGATPFAATGVQTEARGLTFFSPQAFNPSTGALQVGEVNRSILDLEASFARGAYRIQGDYLDAKYSSHLLSNGQDFDRSLKAYYVTLGWLITGENYADWYREGTYIRPRPKNNFGFDKGDGWGLWELNLRYSVFDGSDFNSSNPNFTGKPGTSGSFPNITQTTNKAYAYTVGLKWLPNLYTRLAVNLIRTKFDTPVVVNGKSTDYENAITVRTQVDF
jgi:phosphate-selective porin OprO and OprP